MLPTPTKRPVELVLYGTLGCHLCEQAEVIVWPLAHAQGWTLRTCDIADQADSEQLIARYGLRLPVLRCGGMELDWPFNADDVLRWLSTTGPE